MQGLLPPLPRAGGLAVLVSVLLLLLPCTLAGFTSFPFTPGSQAGSHFTGAEKGKPPRGSRQATTDLKPDSPLRLPAPAGRETPAAATWVIVPRVQRFLASDACAMQQLRRPSRNTTIAVLPHCCTSTCQMPPRRGETRAELLFPCSTASGRRGPALSDPFATLPPPPLHPWLLLSLLSSEAAPAPLEASPWLGTQGAHGHFLAFCVHLGR